MLNKIFTLVQRDWKILIASVILASAIWYHVKKEIKEGRNFPAEVPAIFQQ